ncbi:MAG: GAF domain-containing SpoIIE family protein phosphatase [Phycisphaerae bacterium]
MLRELMDTALLEDFVDGVGRAAGVRVSTFDLKGEIISTSRDALIGPDGRPVTPTRALPQAMQFTPVPAHDPPASVAFLTDGPLEHIVAPVLLNERRAGYVSVSRVAPTRVQSAGDASDEDGQSARENARALRAVRWASRMLSEWCRREERLQTAVEELSLFGDIAELVSGERDLSRTLDRIVSETARVMKCRFSSLRLLDPRTGELTTVATFGLSPEYLNKGPVFASFNEIDADAMQGRVNYVEDVATDPRVQYTEAAKREGIVSVLTAGMLYRGQPVGVLRVYSDRRQRFRTVQRSLLRAIAAQAAIAIVNARLVHERLKTAETERQLKLAGQVQSRMVRTLPPEHPRLQSAMVYIPSSHVGGDFCDFFSLADGRLTAVVADVVGKGIPASLLMASVRGALRAFAACESDLARVMCRLNEHVCRESAPAEFVTLLLVAVDTEARTLSICNAGHEPPLLLRGGHVTRSTEGGLVLGLRPDERYSASTIDLQAGDFLCLYTDGVIEAANFEGRLFGRQRLTLALQRFGGLAPDAALRSILWDIRRFVGMSEQADDLTMVGLRVMPAIDGKPPTASE